MTAEPDRPEEEEPDFSDTEGYKDPIPEQELVGDVLREKPSESELVEEAVIIVDGIPVVPEAKLTKLKAILSKVLGKFGEIRLEHYPTDEEGATLGYCFVAYATKESAREAVSVLDGYSFDKNHIFAANRATDLTKYAKVDDKWVKPEPREYKDLGNLRFYLQHPRGQDQFVIQYEDDKVAVYWNAPHDPDPQPVQCKQRWSETLVQWSPQGTYLATFHGKGIALWAGEKFEQAGRFEHQHVQFLDFSPDEKYVVTFSPPNRKWELVSDCLRVYELSTGALKRTFGNSQLETNFGWPYLRWSPDDAFFSAATSKGIGVYDTKDFSMLDKRSIKLDNLKDFTWSPSSRVMAYWTEESGEIPARVAVMRLPLKDDIRSKNLFNVASATIHWQESGDHLAVQVERYSKKKKKGQSGPEYSGLSYTVEVFRMREKEIPVDTLDVKEKIQALAWEPSGTRFCLISGNNPQHKASVQFYRVQKVGTQLLKTLEQLRSPPSTILWAPSGGWVVLCAMGSGGGSLLFADANNATEGVALLNDRAAHEGATHACWDPTGRYLCTYTSLWEGRTVDLGYRLWNFQGKELCRRPQDRFCQFQWRPRPKSILPEDVAKKVKKELKNYSARFETEDTRERGKASRAVLERRQEQASIFETWRQKARAAFAAEEKARLALRHGRIDLIATRPQDVSDVDMEEETIVLPLTRTETVLERAPDDDE